MVDDKDEERKHDTEVGKSQVGDVNEARKPANKKGKHAAADGVAIESQPGEDLDEHQREHHHVGGCGESVVAHVVRDVLTEESVVRDHAPHATPLLPANWHKGSPTRPFVADEEPIDAQQESANEYGGCE